MHFIKYRPSKTVILQKENVQNQPISYEEDLAASFYNAFKDNLIRELIVKHFPTNNMAIVSNNKRIFKNTIYIYIRLFVTLLIGLYSSRIVLQILGVSDFGIFNIVGGILTAFTFLTSSLSAATNRFFNTEMGKKDGDTCKIFNINQALHISFAFLVFILAETIGLYYIYHYLNIPNGKFTDALFVYHVSIITICLGIINEPYSSLFSAYEQFGFLSAFDVTNSFFRFVCIIALQYIPGNSLRLYAIIMGFTTINMFVIFHWLAHKKWPNTIRFKIILERDKYLEILSFSGWNLLSTVSFMARGTGSDLLFNYFFGTAVNGAYAISRSVNNYISTFSANLDTASAPQIIQSYEAKDYNRCYTLANQLGRFCLLLFELIFFPLYIELDFILHLWLGDVPNGVLKFCQYNLILAAVALTCSGFSQIINASGKIKWFKIIISAFFLVCIPIGYILFKAGYSPYSLLVLFTIADVIQRMVQMVLLKKILHFDALKYMREAWLRPFLIAVIMSLTLYVYSFLQISNNWTKVYSIIGCFILTSFLVYTLGLNTEEKKKLQNIIKSKLIFLHSENKRT